MATRINVRALREDLGLTRETFGQRIQASARTVRRWENGEAEPSSMALKLLEDLQHDEEPRPGPRRREVSV